MYKKIKIWEYLRIQTQNLLFFDISSVILPGKCSRDESMLYADDTVLVYVGTSLQELTGLVNNRLIILLERC